MEFRDRRDAGVQLAAALARYAGSPDVVVLALPRGGVPVGYEIARGLRVPLDVLVVRKLGVPSSPELAMGAIASGGIRVLDARVIDMMGVGQDEIDEVTRREQAELVRREQLFRGDRPAAEVRGKRAILVDDGLATGSTMLAAISALRRRDPAQIIVAVPVAAPQTCELVRARVDGLVVLLAPPSFRAVGSWYVDFDQTTDAEVRELLATARAQERESRAAAHVPLS